VARVFIPTVIFDGERLLGFRWRQLRMRDQDRALAGGGIVLDDVFRAVFRARRGRRVFERGECGAAANPARRAEPFSGKSIGVEDALQSLIQLVGTGQERRENATAANAKRRNNKETLYRASDTLLQLKCAWGQPRTTIHQVTDSNIRLPSPSLKSIL
jgi:hypothetical protein